ncbi:uncharacterized protein [Drosophila kikkawai]|uniref:Uncharacterized protein n=1 Tax=Drosophila kikkawai TaxID=30033 RepID=A0ABM4GE23_DROKI
MTPRYLSARWEVIGSPPTRISAVSTRFLLEIRTASVLCEASSRPATASQDSTARIALFAAISASASSFVTTTSATSSAKPTIVVFEDSGRFSTPLYIVFQSSGPRTEPCGTPAETSCVLVPWDVSTMRLLSLR